MSAERVVTTVVLQLIFDPKLDTEKEIRARVENAMEERIQNGHLEGCEHGAQIIFSKIQVLTTSLT